MGRRVPWAAACRTRSRTSQEQVRGAGPVRHDGTVPELPEIAALALFLRERAVGRVVMRVDVAEISALKTFSPQPAELVGRRVSASPGTASGSI